MGRNREEYAAGLNLGITPANGHVQREGSSYAIKFLRPSVRQVFLPSLVHARPYYHCTLAGYKRQMRMERASRGESHARYRVVQAGEKYGSMARPSAIVHTFCVCMARAPARYDVLAYHAPPPPP